MPDWRIAPPNSLRAVHAPSITPRRPASAAPTGAPSPFEKATITVSTVDANSDSGTPEATLAFHSRAPSMCTGRLRSAATARIARSSLTGMILPPAPLCVFSTQTRLGIGE
jgi:hypothetical protein